MQELIAELNRCMDEGEGRGNVTIAIAGVRAIIKRHETHRVSPLEPLVSKIPFRVLENVMEQSQIIG